MKLKTITHLAKMTTWTTPKGTTTAYTCQHARGKTLIVDRKEEKKRYKEGRRVHTHCPCFLRMTMLVKGNIEVVACFGHYGHDLRIKSIGDGCSICSKGSWQYEIVDE